MNEKLSVLLQQALIPNKILFIVGPTAVGKSMLAVETALACGAEIVSCDAMQVYREVNISSDKPPAGLRAVVPHHLLDVVSVEEDFNAAKYRELAVAAIESILGRGGRAIVCGGSGMYMMAILDGLFETVEIPEAVRSGLTERAGSAGLAALYQQLLQVDPEAAAKINPHDQLRIIRALEVFEAAGRPISQLRKDRKGLWGKYPIALIGLERPRDILYARAEARVEGMFADGLVDEVRGLLQKKLTPSASRLIGIPEVRSFLEGRSSLSRAKEQMKQNTRHYIKRQLTWFRKDKRIEWSQIE